jgi:hypothetical protein
MERLRSVLTHKAVQHGLRPLLTLLLLASAGHKCQPLGYCGCRVSVDGSPRYGPRLLNKISGITGIHRFHLTETKQARGYHASIAQRMSWAANRTTTRIEDEAYCLMGLFGINMPLLYGEGRKAFVRLQEEVIKRSRDQSIFAWRAPSEFVYSRFLKSQQLKPIVVEAATLFGLLAPSPKWFAASGNIKFLSHREPRPTEPFMITSEGIDSKPSPLAKASGKAAKQHYSVRVALTRVQIHEISKRHSLTEDEVPLYALRLNCRHNTDRDYAQLSFVYLTLRPAYEQLVASAHTKVTSPHVNRVPGLDNLILPAAGLFFRRTYADDLGERLTVLSSEPESMRLFIPLTLPSHYLAPAEFPSVTFEDGSALAVDDEVDLDADSGSILPLTQDA